MCKLYINTPKILEGSVICMRIYPPKILEVFVIGDHTKWSIAFWIGICKGNTLPNGRVYWFTFG